MVFLIHKIDRSARNLKDWADLGELIDAGVEVHFAADALDLVQEEGDCLPTSRQLSPPTTSANLREEAKKESMAVSSKASTRFGRR